MSNRRILRLSGADTRSFLQGLVTSNVDRLKDGLVYTALLTPQGKTSRISSSPRTANPSCSTWRPAWPRG